MSNSTEQEYHLLTTDQILAQMQQWEDRADTLYDELIARVNGTPGTSFDHLAHDELLAESERVQLEWLSLQDVIVERAQQRDQLLASLEKTPACTPSSEDASPLTSSDFEHIAPEVLQDFLCEKIEWLQTFAKGRITATVDETSAADQMHERELLEFLLFAEHKAKESIAYQV